MSGAARTSCGITITTNATISMTSGSAGTYYLVIYINTNATNTACHANVTANNPSSTTIGAKTVRLAIVTSSAYSSPPAGVDLIPLHSISWNGTAITAVVDMRKFTEPSLPSLHVFRMIKTASQSIATGTGGVDVTTYATRYQMPDGLITGNVSNGVISLNARGVYLVEASVLWATQGTPSGDRWLRLNSANESVQEVCATTLTASALEDVGGGTLSPTNGFIQRLTTTIFRDQVNTTSTPSYETLFLRVAQDSGTAQNITRASITVTRLSDIPPIV